MPTMPTMPTMPATFDPAKPCIDLLPPRPGYIRGAGVTWCPVGRVLELTTDRKRQRVYAVREFSADEGFGGRAFQLRKLTTGTDSEAEGYDVLISHKGPEHDACECKGFLRHGHCSHLDGIRCVVSNGWDVTPTADDATPTDDEIDAMFADQERSGSQFEPDDDAETDQEYAERMYREACEEARREREAMRQQILDEIPECFRDCSTTTDDVPF